MKSSRKEIERAFRNLRLATEEERAAFRQFQEDEQACPPEQTRLTDHTEDREVNRAQLA